ncbi:HTH-type transcriptional regulator TsaQ1/TsaQ2 (plasmid) [Caballeronia sp. SBC1]|nr:HTH-type transcriptional regulator TsaQ1/TsaQ2 [Caballeronia sp. SBC2]QIN64047.1 HTH-type transcriptional regulator TsaQ1/TsaQ2 [Caballeronia sp. SBC1]
MGRKRAQVLPIADLGEDSGDRQFVSGLAKGLTLLRFLTKGEVLGTTDLARLSGLPNASVSRLCYTLTNLGYLEYLPEAGKYRLGDACLSLGYLYMASDLVSHIARPLMTELAAFSRVPICIARRHELSMRYIARESTDDQLSLRLEVGSVVPIERTAMGHAYLAGLDDEKRQEMLDQLGSKVPDMDSFRRQIDDNINLFSKKGFCIANRMWMKHIRAVAVPLRMRDSGNVVAFNCGGIADYLEPAFLMNEVGPRLVALVREVEKILESQSQPPSQIETFQSELQEELIPKSQTVAKKQTVARKQVAKDQL